MITRDDTTYHCHTTDKYHDEYNEYSNADYQPAEPTFHHFTVITRKRENFIFARR
jgi:hypothetical protein